MGKFVPFEKSSKDKSDKGMKEGSNKEKAFDKKQMPKGMPKGMPKKKC